MNNFHIHDVIGRGRRSVVYKGRRKKTVDYVAIKSTDRDLKPSVLQEVKVLHALKHPNILGFQAWYETTNHLWLILELCVGGDLRALLRDERRLPEPAALALARDLAAGLSHLHAAGTLHCDLRPANVLLDEAGRAKLTGFAASRRVAAAAAGGAAPAAPPAAAQYTAPELAAGGPPSSASDLWALGCVLYECTAGRRPFGGGVTAGQPPRPLPAEVGADFRDLVARLLEPHPGRRLTWAQLWAHPVWSAAPAPLPPLPRLPAEPALAEFLAGGGGGGGAAAAPALQPHAAAARPDDGLLLDPSASGELDDGAAEADTDAGAPPSFEGAAGAGPEALVWHSTDATLKPIVGNRRIEAVPEPQYDAGALPCAAPAAADLLALPPRAQAELLGALAAAAGGPSPAAAAAALGYVGSLAAASPPAAQLLANSEVALLAVRLLGEGGTPAPLAERLARALGLLLRHAADVGDDLATAGLVPTLAARVRDAAAPPTVRRAAAAALGEALFYAACQHRDRAADAPGPWRVPPAVLRLLVEQLEDAAADEVVQHYAAKTVENVAGQGGAWADALLTPAAARALCGLLRRGRSEGVRGTAASALARAFHARPDLMAAAAAEALAAATEGLAQAGGRARQGAATVLCQLLLGEATAAPAAAAAGNALVDGLSALLESHVPVLRAKATLAAALLCRAGGRGALAACAGGLLHLAERCAARDGDAYTAAALGALHAEAAGLVPALLRGAAGSPADALAALQALLESAEVRRRAVGAPEVAALASLLRAARGEAALPALQAADAVCGDAPVLARAAGAVLDQLLPALAAAVAAGGAEGGDARFMALKLLCDAVLALAANPAVYARPADGGDGAAAGAAASTTAAVDAAVARHVLPLMPALLEDEDPMPLYALKLLGMLLGVNAGWAPPLVALGCGRRFFGWLSVDHPHNNVHNIRLCRAVAACGAMTAAQLEAAGAPGRALAVLAYAHANGVEPFVEPALELCVALVDASAGAPEFAAATPLLLALVPGADPALGAGAAYCVAALAARAPDGVAAALAGADGSAALAAALGAPQPEGELAGVPAAHLLHTLQLVGEPLGQLADARTLREVQAAVDRVARSSADSEVRRLAAGLRLAA